MSTNIDAKLNQGYRNALLSYYIGNYVPDNNLDSFISTPEDVYEYLLIDPLVTNDVPTSRVAQAMSSIQQYINGISLNMEPGYSTSSLDAPSLKQWSEGANQYSVWGGEVELDTYPENYLDPTLRQGKSSSFQELESMLNQSSLTDATEQNCVLTYLSEFENIANLDITCGYLDGVSIEQSIYYFIGKTRTTPVKYYFRTLDMRERTDGVIPFSAWSEWLQVDVSLNEDAVVGALRPIMFNNRLYVIWYEKSVTGQDDNGNDISTIKAYSSYYNIDKTWSAPNVLIAVNSQDDPQYKNLFNCPDLNHFYTIAVHVIPADADQAESLSVCLYTDYVATQSLEATTYTDLSIKIDYWFNQPTVAPGFFGDFYNEYAGAEGQAQVQYTWNMTTFTTKVTLNEMVNTFPETDITDNLSLTTDDIMISDTGATITSSFALSSLNYDTCDLRVTGTASVNNGVPLQFELAFDFRHPNITVSGSIAATQGNFYTHEKIISIEIDNITKGGFGSQHDISEHSSETGGTGTLITLDEVTFQAPEVDFNYSDTYRITFYSNNTEISEIHNYKTNNFKFPEPDHSWHLEAWQDGWETGTSLGEYTGNSLAKNQSITTNNIPNLSSEVELNYCYGVKRDSSPSVNAYKKYIVSFIPATGKLDAGEIKSSTNTQQGQAKYIAFSDGNNIRLNTLFARELINKASISIDELLTWDTQLTEEPSLTGDGVSVPMDFNGANGRYFWELFFHMPWLVAHRLYQEEQYSDAQRWFNYIFDPAACGRTSSNPAYPEPDYWNVRPLVEAPTGETQSSMVLNPLDPDAIAVADPVHYQKAIFIGYITNLIAAADADYRLLTNDGLSQAKLRYCQVLDLLGPRPDIQLLNQWVPDTLANIAEKTDAQLALFEPENANNLLGIASTGAAQNVIDNACFTEPLNTLLVNFWNTVDSRLYNLRHYLSIDGQPLNIPLYAPLANPTSLMQQYASASAPGNAATAWAMSIPPYRFITMLQSAKNAVGTLSQTGQTLLGYYERGDSAGLQESQHQQMLDISGFTLQLQQQSIDALNADARALQASKAVAQQRYEHYYALYNQGVSASEQEVMNMQTTSGSLMTAAGALLSTGAAMNMVPNIFGVADGGCVWGASMTAAGGVLQLSAEATNIAADRIAASEQFRRRGEDWQIQYQQAQSEMDAIDDQLSALNIRQQAAQTSLQQAQAQQNNLQATMNLLKTRFSNSSLYRWLCGQLSALYCQAYDAVLSLCLSTQSCWQYEMGDLTTTFVQTGAWNDSYHGLLVGETLQLNLQQMESAWLSRNQRRLELTKTISLKQLLGDSAFSSLVSTGSTTFSLSEALFDNDYPGHYLRQIKYVTVSLPTLVGPYQDVRATLMQTSSSTLLKADINGVKYLNGTSDGSATNVISNQRASQQIAVSSGVSDSGLFVLNFGDDRYLPFEGTGAVSSWQLAFPCPDSDEQKALLGALNDVIVQLHYTAVYGGSSFEQAVASLNP
ncbi:neuraminidase-like domain-containing protein [Enterobacter sp.]|uniref:Tc toxin subunit A-related protein n=1 Tax=Enterobacter sp. TaxID=42895 RepID=UPI00296EBB93|nr:neuraminidase-like domain-containing protein [Enterobacter sp.]